MKPIAWLGFDAAFMLLWLLLVGPPAAAVAWAISHTPLPVWATAALVPLWYLAFLLGLIAMIRLVRALVPRLEPGTYPFPDSAMARAWLVHFALQRIANMPLWAPFLFGFASLRWLVLTARGARAAFAMQSANDAEVVDAPMVELGQGCMLAAGTLIAGHLIEHDQLFLARVTVGPGAQIMGQTTLAPGVTVGRDAVVGPGAALLPGVDVGEDAYVGLGCMIHNGVRIGPSAVVGHHAIVEADVVLEEGTTVAPGARVPRGTTVPAGTAWPPRNHTTKETA